MWRKPTEDDIVATLSRNEVEAYRKDFEIEAVERLLSDTVAYVRTYISSNGNVRMDPDESTLPASCISPAMDYAAFKLLKRRNVKVNADRETAYNDAMTYFRDVAAGKVNPESYGSATTDTTGGPAVEIVTSSRPRTDASRLEGL